MTPKPLKNLRIISTRERLIAENSAREDLVLEIWSLPAQDGLVVTASSKTILLQLRTT